MRSCRAFQCCRPSVRHSPVASIDFVAGRILAAVLIAYPLGYTLITRGMAAWNINAYNMVFLTLALLLHGRPESLVKGFVNGASTASGIILQFPFYAGIFGVMKNTPLGEWMGHLFVEISTPRTFPLVVYVLLGIHDDVRAVRGARSGSSRRHICCRPRATSACRWALPCCLYAYGDATAHLIQPFWAIPILTVTRLRFGDVVGFSLLVFAACFVASVVAMLLIPLTL